MKNHYLNILELSPNATDKDIKKAFRQLALQYHPDKNQSPEANTKFLQICEAYEWLTNPDSRTKKTSATNGYQQNANDLEERLKKAREILKKRKQIEELEEIKAFFDFKNSFVYKSSKIIYVFSLIMALLLIFDHFLKPIKVSGFLKDYYEISSSSRHSNDLSLIHYYFQSEKGLHEFRRYQVQGTPPPIRKNATYELHFSPLLSSFYALYFDQNAYKNVYSVHFFFNILMIPLLLPLIPLLIKEKPRYERIVLIRLSYFLPLIVIFLIFVS
ncbi:MAG: J domain-containing protein [Bacteroidia bacterium]